MGSDLPTDLVVVRRTAELMDRAFTVPGTNIRIGWDAIVGLVPGAGDVAGGIVSSTILLAALRHRVPFRVLVQMVVNILMDMGVGTVPLVGDVIDALWHNNVRNVDLLLAHRDVTQPPREVPAMVKLVVVGVMGAFTAVTVGVAWLIVWGLSVLWHLL